MCMTPRKLPNDWHLSIRYDGRPSAEGYPLSSCPAQHLRSSLLSHDARTIHLRRTSAMFVLESSAPCFIWSISFMVCCKSYEIPICDAILQHYCTVVE